MGINTLLVGIKYYRKLTVKQVIKQLKEEEKNV